MSDQKTGTLNDNIFLQHNKTALILRDLRRSCEFIKGVIRVDQYDDIRQVHIVEGMSQQAIVRELGISRNMVWRTREVKILEPRH